jgi:hypothetical protein
MRGLILLLAPMCVAWQASGDGAVEWARGDGKTPGPSAFVQAEVVARVEPGVGLSLVATLELPGADGLLTVRVEPPPAAGDTVELPDPRVKVGYTEYADDGTVRFALDRVTAGRLRMPPQAASPFELGLALDVAGGDGAWRRLKDGDLVLRPSVAPARGDDDDYGGGVTVAVDPVYGTGGCDGSYHEPADYSEDYDDSAGSASDGGGCEGDDVDGGGESSGCDGDDLGGGSDSGSGCAGDDVASSGGGCDGGGADSCAVAPTSGVPRAGRAWQRRLVAWLPWIATFLALRLMRARKILRRR